MKHGGGSMMVWGCLTPDGPGRLCGVEGNMDAIQYCKILKKGLLGTLTDHGDRQSVVIFQQDKDPKHKSHLAMTWFAEHNIRVLPWIPNSPDMNIIEHVWKHLNNRVHARKRLPSNTEELWAALKEEWEAIDGDFIRRLYESMPHHVAALRKAKGSYVKY